MKRSVIWPPKVRAGRLAMTEDPESDPLDPNAALRQVIRLNLLDGSSSNPWNQVGTPDPTFQPNDATTRARLRARVRQVFRKLERAKRAKLAGISFDRVEGNRAALSMRIDFLNLETGGRTAMEVTRNG